MRYSSRMTHHAYLVEGEQDVALARIEEFLKETLGFESPSDPDIERHATPQLSIDDARALLTGAMRSAAGNRGKVIVISTQRLFHEAQNALLKLFEEPPAGVTFILSIPRAGILLPTLQSRLMSLPGMSQQGSHHPLVAEFLAGDSSAREKLIAKLVDRSKDTTDAVKQRARAEAAGLVEGLIREVHSMRDSIPADEFRSFMKDAHAFLPVLHQRSAPLKLILEHLRLTIPSAGARV